ncbi:MAG TPA: YqcI/YcgG family protein [Kofleriaceae bacterium]|nr:YqcI/YcgG family protein [Kofleriaceae bacterium]
MEDARLYATSDPLTEAPAWFRASRAHLHRTFLDPADPYPCYFAELGERRATNYYTYLVPGADRDRISDAELGALARALRAFLRLPRAPAQRLSLLCLVEPPASPVSFAEHRARYWDVLRQLIARDADPWPAGTPAHPDDPGWNFCFAGEPLFTFGACPAYHPRRSRALGPGLVMVFQPLTIFADIGGSTDAGRAAKRQIRDRLRGYERVPLLADAGDGSGSTVAKWKQYFPSVDGAPASGPCPVSAARRTTGKGGGLP